MAATRNGDDPQLRRKAVGALYARCRLCTVILSVTDDPSRGLCVDCKKRPEAKPAIAKRVTERPPPAVLVAKPATVVAATPPPPKTLERPREIKPPARILRPAPWWLAKIPPTSGNVAELYAAEAAADRHELIAKLHRVRSHGMLRVMLSLVDSHLNWVER